MTASSNTPPGRTPGRSDFVCAESDIRNALRDPAQLLVGAAVPDDNFQIFVRVVGDGVRIFEKRCKRTLCVVLRKPAHISVTVVKMGIVLAETVVRGERGDIVEDLVIDHDLLRSAKYKAYTNRTGASYAPCEVVRGYDLLGSVEGL